MIAKSIYIGTLIAAVNGAVTYAAARWAFGRSHKIFYGVFFGGMLWKLACLFAVCLFLMRNPVADIPAVLLSMAATTFILNLIEAGLFYKAVPEAHGL